MTHQAIIKEAANLPLLDRVSILGAVLSTFEVSNPAIAAAYERLCDAEAALIAQGIDDGTISVQKSSLEDLRLRYEN